MTKIDDSSVHLIITSPPYTRVIRYGTFNWIRLWFFGKTGKEVDKKLFFSQSMDKYCDFMTASLIEMKRVLKSNGKAVLVIGDVKDRTSDKIFNLAEEVWQRCAKPLGFKLVEPIKADVIRDETKVSKIWGKTKGNATKIDRVLVLENN
jgi:site-specific DNA-methyltransferase (adenine-specific)